MTRIYGMWVLKEIRVEKWPVEFCVWKWNKPVILTKIAMETRVERAKGGER